MNPAKSDEGQLWLFGYELAQDAQWLVEDMLLERKNCQYDAFKERQKKLENLQQRWEQYAEDVEKLAADPATNAPNIQSSVYQTTAKRARHDADTLKQLLAIVPKWHDCRPTKAALVPLTPVTVTTPPLPQGSQKQRCRTPADDARYLELDAEMQRLNAEHERVFNAATNKAGQDALRDLNRRLDELQNEKEEIRARKPCPPEPKVVQVPPANEPGMVPVQPGGPDFGFGVGGGRFGIGGGSDDRRR